jgi:hypothetical protein
MYGPFFTFEAIIWSTMDQNVSTRLIQSVWASVKENNVFCFFRKTKNVVEVYNSLYIHLFSLAEMEADSGGW